MRFRSKIILLLLSIIIVENCAVNPNYSCKKAYDLRISGKYDKSIELLEKELEKYPNNTRILFNLGNYYLEMGEFNKSINVYEKAVKLVEKSKNNESSNFTKYYEIIDNLALAYLFDRNYKKAILLAKEASKPGYDSDQPLWILLNSQILTNDLENGIKNFEKYKRKNPYDNEVLVLSQYMNNKISKNSYESFIKSSVITANQNLALDFIKQSLKEHPNNKEFLKLERKYKNPNYISMKMKEDKFRNNSQIARELVLSGNAEKAEEIIFDLNYEYSKKPEVIELNALLYAAKGSYLKGAKEYKKLLKIEHLEQPFLYNLGFYHFAYDQYDSAKVYFLDLININPDYPDVNYRLSYIEKINKNHLQAIQYAKKEISLNGINNEVSYYIIGDEYFLLKKYDEAYNAFKKYKKYNEHNIKVDLTIAEIFNRQGKANRFTEYLKNCLIYYKYENAHDEILSLFQNTDENKWNFDSKIKKYYELQRQYNN